MLGLGPGIDYAAVGEAMAFGQIIQNWQRAYQQLEIEFDLAQRTISRQNALIADIQEMQKEGREQDKATIDAFAEQAQAIIARGSAELERSKVRQARLLELSESQRRQTERAIERNDKMLADVAVLAAHGRGVEKMVLALAEALATASPGHPLISPTGETGSDGEPLDGIDAAFLEGYADMATKLRCETPADKAQARVDEIRKEAVEAIRSARSRAEVVLEDRVIFPIDNGKATS